MPLTVTRKQPPAEAGAIAPAELLVRLVDMQDAAALIPTLRALWPEVNHREARWRESIIMLGITMIAAKAKLANGEFGPWLAEHVFAVPKAGRAKWMSSGDWRKAQRYMQAATRVLAEAGVEFRELADWPINQLAAAPEDGAAGDWIARIRAAIGGRTLGQLLLPWSQDAVTPGGYHVAPAAVRGWLAKHHPGVQAAGYNDLAPELQAEFRKQWRPKISAAEKVRMAQAACANLAKHLREFATTRPKPWTRLDAKDRAALAQQLMDVSKLLGPER